MASRRMFSSKIIDSAKFLKMPISSQLLYFHLGMRADDDGVVEAFNVLRLIGSAEDDLKILVSKGYIQVLNEDLVSFISDWTEHNKIRADRKIDSIYKNLLLQVVNGVELIETRPRADSKKKETIEFIECCPADVQLSDKGQLNVGIGKVRLGKDRLEKDNASNDARLLLKSQYEELWKLYPNKKGKAQSIKKIPKLIKEYGFEKIKECIERYIHEVTINKTEKKFMKHGSTFFNGGYMDYLEEQIFDPIEVKEVKKIYCNKCLNGWINKIIGNEITRVKCECNK